MPGGNKGEPRKAVLDEEFEGARLEELGVVGGRRAGARAPLVEGAAQHVLQLVVGAQVLLGPLGEDIAVDAALRARETTGVSGGGGGRGGPPGGGGMVFFLLHVPRGSATWSRQEGGWRCGVQPGAGLHGRAVVCRYRRRRRVPSRGSRSAASPCRVLAARCRVRAEVTCAQSLPPSLR